MKKLLLLLLLTLNPMLFAQTSTEVFETESKGSTSFTDNGVIFNIISHTSEFKIQGDVATIGTGWNGTQKDNRYIDNTGPNMGNGNASFSIKTTSNLFKVNRFWVFLSTEKLNQSVSGSLTITGKLSGIAKFTQTKMNGFATELGTTNGFTLIDLTNLNGQNYSNIIIDELVLTANGGYRYFALDAFTWVKDSGVIIPCTLKLPTDKLPSASINVPYSYSFNTSEAATHSFSTGLFPPGLKMSTSGTLEGTPTEEGTYNFSVEAKNSQGCIDSKDYTLIINKASLSATILQINVSCFGGKNGTAAVISSGGTAPYSCSWTRLGSSLVISNTDTASTLPAGDYQVTITDSNGVTGKKEVKITQPDPLIATASWTNVSCNGGANGTATVVVSGGTGNYTYSWSPSGGTAATATGLTAGTYTVTVTDAKSCTTTQSVTITQPTVLTATTSQTNVSCFGGYNGTATVIPSGGTAPYSYLWSTGATTKTITGLKAGAYTVTITDFNNCSIEKEITITQPDPIKATTSQTNVSCNGGANGTVSVNVAGGAEGYSYKWSTGATTSSITGLTAGNYTVTITDANSCTTRLSITITEPKALTGTISGTNVSCNGGSNGTATVTPLGGTKEYIYSWSPSGGTAATATGLTAGTYSVTITDVNGCSATQSFKITQPDPIKATTSQTNVSCNGGANGTVSVNVAGGAEGYSYKWSTGATTSSITGLTAGNYTVTITDANSCTTRLSITITEPKALTGTISGTNVSCNGGSNGTATVTPLGGTKEYTYSWSPSGGTAATATGLTSGTYTVTITDANGCSATRSFKITEPRESLKASLVSQSNVSCNGGSNGTATVVASGGSNGYTYSWAPMGGTSATATGLTAGTYTVTITDVNGCSATQSFKITQPDPIKATTSQTNVSCNGGANGTATVVASGGAEGYAYLWSNGATTKTITGLKVGDYTVIITDANNCTTTQSVTILDGDVLTLPMTDTSLSYKYGDTPQPLSASSLNGNKLNWYTEESGKPSNVSLIAPTPSTSKVGQQVYYVSQVNSFGCESPLEKIIVTITPAELTVTATTQSKVYGSSDSSLSYTVLGLVNNEPEVFVLSGSLSRAAGENVGTYLMGKGTLTANSNYSLSFTGANLTITPAKLTVTATAQSKVYGAVDPKLDYVVSGLQFTDKDIDVLSGSLSRVTGENVGSYAINQNDLKANSNYTLDFKTANLSIGTAPLTVTANKLSKVYGAVDPKLDYTVSGLVNNDKETDVLTGSLSRVTGENVGTYVINQNDLKANGNYTLDFKTADLTITSAKLTVTANKQSKVYGAVDPKLDYTVSGLVNNDKETAVLSGSLSRITGENVGSYAITQNDLKANGNYTLDFKTANLTIGTAPLTVTANKLSKVYGAVDPKLDYSVSGLQFTDKETAVLSGSLSRITGENVGSYAITQNDLKANGNYTLDFKTADLTISTAPLTVTTTASTKIYGAVDPKLAYTVSGLVNNDKETDVLSGGLSRIVGENVGTYAITQNDLKANGNYTLDFKTANLTIGTAPLTVTATTQSKVYGTVDPTLDYAVSGLKGGDTLSGSLSRIAGENVGTYAINQNDLKANGNYTLDFKIADLTITPAVLTVTATTQSKVYGAVDPKLDYTVLGLVNNDKETAVLSGSLSRAIGEDVGTYTINQGDLKANGNYALDFKTANLTIGTAPLTVTANAKTKVYGAVDPKLDYTVSGLQFTDKEADVLTGSLSRVTGENVGSYTINLGTLTANSNYTLDFKTANLTIGTVPLTVTANKQSKVYGAVDPKLDYTVSGLQFTDKEVDVLSGSLSRIAGENVGMYAIDQNDLKANGNYTLDFKTTNLTISTAPLTVTTTASTKIYGAVDPKLAYTVSGLVNNDKETAVLSGGLSRITGENVGMYAINQNDLKANGNYTVDFKTANLTITPAELTVTATTQSKVYGAVDPKLDYTVSGLQFTDKETAVLSGGLSRIVGENVGTYAINQNDLKANGNYTLDYKTTNLTIGTAPLIVTTTAKSKVYGAVDPKFDYTVLGLVNNDKEADVLSGSLSRAVGENVGVYSINQNDLKANGNYTLDFKTANLTIGTAPLTVTTTTSTKLYGAVDPKLDYTVSGLQFTDKVADILSGSLFRIAGENVGSYAITQGTLTANSNYTLSYVSNNLVITPATISGLSLTDAIYTYDGIERTLMLKGNLPSDMQVSYTANKQTEAGVYQITALVTGANYKDLTLKAKLTITKAKQHIEFGKLSPVIYNRNLQLQLSAISSSGLPITYSSADEVGVAIVDPLGLVKILKPGSIVIAAQQVGNNNYEPAQGVSQVLLIQNDEAIIEGLSINGSNMGKISSNEYFMVDCNEVGGQVDITLETSVGATVNTDNSFVIRTPKAGIYRQEIIVSSQSEKASKKYVIEIERPFIFDEIVTQKFNNTLIANNNPLTNGGYTFTGYRWFRNGQLIGTGQIYSVGNNKEDLLDREALYSVELTTDKGEVLHSCPSTIRYSNTNSIKLYPNPVVKQGELEIAIDYPDSSLKDVTAAIYSVTGQFLFKTVLQDRISKVVLPYTLVEGSYIMIIKIDGKNKTFRFIVKP